MRSDRERLEDIAEAIDRILARTPVHHYFEIIPGIIWRVVKNDLPPLKQLVAGLLS